MPAPFVFNDDVSNLVQISMQGSVGQGGGNARDDTALVQKLLNAVPAAGGGPDAALKVDGLIGPKSIIAIKRFQTANKLIVDGRIDAYRNTIKTLVPLVRGLGRLPVGMSNLGRPNPEIAAALAPASTVKSLASLPDLKKMVGSTVSKWKFKGSGMVGFSVDFFGAAGGDFLVEADDAPGVTRRLAFGGLSVGLSVAPVGLDVAFESMPSIGSRILRSPVMIPPYEDVGDFRGQCLFISVGANAPFAIPGLPNGLSGAVVHFQRMPLSGASGALAGLQTGIPTAGISLFSGLVVHAR